MPYDEQTAQRVRRTPAGRDFVEKKVMGALCSMVQGAICCSVSGRGGLLIRVGPELRPQLVREPYASPMKMGPRTMSGFVSISMWRNTWSQSNFTTWSVTTIASIFSTFASTACRVNPFASSCPEDRSRRRLFRAATRSRRTTWKRLFNARPASERQIEEIEP